MKKTTRVTSAFLFLLLAGSSFTIGPRSRQLERPEIVRVSSIWPEVSYLEVFDRAKIIVEGSVRTALPPKWNKDRSKIFTDYIFTVTRWHKGSGPREVTIRQLGGRLGDTEMVDVEGPKLSLGSPVVLCLSLGKPTEYDYSGLYYITLGPSGVFTPGQMYITSRKTFGPGWPVSLKRSDFAKLIQDIESKSRS